MANSLSYTLWKHITLKVCSIELSSCRKCICKGKSVSISIRKVTVENYLIYEHIVSLVIYYNAFFLISTISVAVLLYNRPLRYSRYRM